MKQIADLLSRDLSRRIEEVIQVDEAEEQAVFTEIDEYIATDSIRELYAQLLRGVAEAPSDPAVKTAKSAPRTSCRRRY